MAQLFGFSITRAKKQQDPKQGFTNKRKTVHKPVAAGGYFGQYLDMEGTTLKMSRN